MSLTSTYRSFLAAPSPASLAEDAALNYVPTLKTISGAADIEKHLAREQKLYKKKREEVLHAIESDNALCLELDTTIEFTAGGGVLLPGLDDNFLSEQIVTLPMVHIVQFSGDSKIQQVRIYWDQASLLKAVEVIGSRAKNWPVKDGVDHVRIIKKSTSSAPMSANTPVKGSLPSRPKSVLNAMRDPMASLELFAPRNVDAEDEEDPDRPRLPRGSARPPPREYSELFAAAQDDPRERSESPSKSRNRAKTGAGKNYHETRVFNPEEMQAIHQSPQKPVVEKKYHHFEFSDGHDEPSVEPAEPRPRTKHQSQWDFEDFVTPAKAGNKVRDHDKPNFTLGGDDEQEEHEAPSREKGVAQARRDAESHFELQDDGEPRSDRDRRPPRGPGSMNKSAGLYKNNLYDEQGLPGTPRNEASGIVTNFKSRGKDFEPHWQMTEGTPKASKENPDDRRSALQRPISTVVDNESRKKDFGSHFDIQDDSPKLAEKSASDRNRDAGGRDNKGGINRRGAGQASWSLTGEEEPQSARKIYRTAGDGMGSRTGNRSWGIGDDSADEGEDNSATPINRKKQPVRSNDWQF